MRNRPDLCALGHEIDQGHIRMNPLFYAAPYNMTPLKPKDTDIKKDKRKRDNASKKNNSSRR